MNCKYRILFNTFCCHSCNKKVMDCSDRLHGSIFLCYLTMSCMMSATFLVGTITRPAFHWICMVRCLTCSIIPLFLYCMSKRPTIMWYLLSVQSYTWEYRPVLIPKEDMQCIDMESECSWYNIYFETFVYIALYMQTFSVISVIIYKINPE